MAYGDIGVRDQNEFTVIGDTGNCTARIASTRNSLGEHALPCERFAAHFPG